MRIIKLDAIDSTNDFLKELTNHQILENFTIVTAENQIKGKGQMGTTWTSEPSKNLLMSVLINNFLIELQNVFNINIVFSVSVIQVLKTLNIPELSIKWPNDILSYNKKIGGILIENILKSEGKIISIVGFGLNVNQTNFSQLAQASSLYEICKTSFDKEVILAQLIEKLQVNCKNWSQNNDLFMTEYNNLLFKKGIPMPFCNKNQEKFMGIIQGVSAIGKLQILLEDDSIALFDTKEIQMLY
jgi:BirA family transcriptional regulator, biotin operon repressor / biotin---[acetyl-CoA-carboxylase] ligase